MNIGKIGSYVFEIYNNSFENFNQSLNAEFSSFTPILGQKALGNQGGYTEVVRLDGVSVNLPTDNLDYLRKALIDRMPIRLTTNSFDEHVVIRNLEFIKSHFAPNGDFKVCRYNISIEVLYGEII